ncbi:MAG: alpha/beta hydrolase, partial [Anaerolineae bacterium]|nr:alpha/beta hydrolase [Anaerolineae bacterium]
MRRVILIHDWMGHSEFAWYPYIKETLEPRHFRVLIPMLPHADLPDPDEWLETLSETIGTPGKHLTLIGHGLGCAAV